ncbi:MULTISPECIES: hypothetical protein [Nitrospirillum]|uniref:NlpC/P60 family protein n=1 Tax=Nitrospirillum amazonense TaxID=28077 RepID=A0A560FW22_9PROT|nr:hypothetical protein [Nitrospirillum amazonense]MEC4592565.1 hypothetical protein [Nitrospirillum amazonense]TWB25838.1 hypothetical protein FBZ88_109237 [Nitrospirillum amazonense]
MPEPTIISVCERNWEKWKADCSGFLKAVAADLGISLSGQANDIIDTMGHAPWIQLGNDSEKAVTYAGQSYLVVAGLKAPHHGHVVVIVPGAPKPYPSGYWGRFGGTGRKNTSISWSWKHSELPEVRYFAVQLNSAPQS